MEFIASFTENGVPKGGLVVTIDIWRTDTGALVVDGTTPTSMTEIAGTRTSGSYKYVYAAADPTLNYVATATSDLSGREKYAQCVCDGMSLTTIFEGSRTVGGLLRLLFSNFLTLKSGGGTTAHAYRDATDAKDRITKTVDINGNVTVVTLDDT